MIISEPNDFVAEVHDRMPVLLAPDQFEHWLSGNMTVEELKLAPNDYLPSAGRAVPARRLFGPTL
jgi:putative SOS response-associated peptidase YedK